MPPGMRYGYTPETAPPGMRWAYEALQPRLGTQYGDVLPVAKDADGSIRPAMPNVMRDGLLGLADLLSGIDTGELTGRGAASITMGGLGAGMGMAPRGAIAAGGAKPIKAYHGSPHDFDRFSFDKIGTGEGAQAYGHGLYFAENEGVARSYRNVLTPLKEMYYGDTPWTKMQDAEMARWLPEVMRGGNTPADWAAKKQYWLDRIGTANPESRAALERLDPEALSMRGPDGRMYEVAIHADPKRFLDWDKPLSGQSPAVQKALEPMGYRPNASALREYDDALLAALQGDAAATLPKQPADPSGAAVYRRTPSAAVAMQQAGIPGIRYLDQGSRSAGEGSHNYVVFPTQDEIIEILRKYGMSVPAPVGVPQQQPGMRMPEHMRPLSERQF